MYRIYIHFIWIPLLALYCSCNNPTQDVIDRQLAFVDIINSMDGTQMARYIDQASTLHMQKLYDLAQEYNMEKIAAYFNQDLQTKLIDNIIFIYANKIPKTPGYEMDYKGFLEFSTTNGMYATMDTTQFHQIRVKELEPEHMLLTIPTMNSGYPLGLAEYHWYRENGSWKLNLENHLLNSEKHMLRFIQQSGATRKQFLDNISATSTYLRGFIILDLPPL